MEISPEKVTKSSDFQLFPLDHNYEVTSSLSSLRLQKTYYVLMHIEE